MSDFGAMLGGVVDVMKYSFTIWGYTLSFWEILLWSLGASLVIWLIVGFFNG